MGRENLLLPLAALVVGGWLPLGCYSTQQLRVQVQSPARRIDCVRAADRVFADAGFERVPTALGSDMFYSPRTRPGARMALGWGIAAWLNHDEPNGCALTIEAMSPEPSASRDPLYSAQRGESIDATVREMARRLEVAFAAAP
jgi:hypothetical protein